MATARGGVKAPAGTVSGVSSPWGVPATGRLNAGAQRLNQAGPMVNGGSGKAPPSPFSARAARAKLTVRKR